MNSLPFDFGAPWYLLLLLVLPVVIWWSRSSLAGLSATRRYTAVGLRLFVLLLLILALAETRFLKRNDRLALLFVIDRSESIPADKRAAALQYVNATSQGRDALSEDLVGVVTFGKTAGIEWIPKAEDVDIESYATLIEPDGTDIAAGIRLAVAAFPDGVGKRIVLLTDGNETGGNVLEEIRKARAQGITVDVVPIHYDYKTELIVEDIRVPPQVHNSQPFDIRVSVNATHKTKAYVRLSENDREIENPSGTDIVELEPGKNVIDFSGLRIDLSGHYFYEVRLEPVERKDDSLLQNNTAFGFTVVQGEPKILLCTDQEDDDVTLASALRAEKLQVQVIGPEFLPSRAEEYLDYDAIFLSNVPSHQLSEDTMQLFEGLVKTIGMGFVMVGGEQSFGAGAYKGTPVERLLPVEMDIKQRKTMPNGAICMVVHSCELGNGNLWARRVIQKAIQTLAPRDYAGVIAYTNGVDQWLFKMRQVGPNRQTMLNQLNSFQPGDMMSFRNIISMAHKGLSQAPASIKHMIVLSDGDPTMPSPQLVQAIRATPATISTICYGSHGVNPVGMRQLAQAGGGKFHYLQGPENLPELFIREVMTVTKSLISEETFVPQVAEGGPILRGLDALPSLDGLVMTTPKPLATISLVHPPRPKDPTLDPLLATWTYGAGKSVAFTSDAGTRWGKAWASSSEYQQFWTQCARWVMRQRSSSRFRFTRSIEAGRGVVTIDAITPDGQYINGLDFDANVMTPDFKPTEAETRQVGPGQYKVSFPVDSKGSYTVSMQYADEDDAPHSIVTGLSVPYSSEYAELETNFELLESLALAGQGRYYEDPSQVDFFSRDFVRTRDVQPIWWGLLLAAVFLFFLDVFLRRVVVNYGRVIANACASAVGWVTGRKAKDTPADERLATLLARKEKLQESRETRYRPADEESGEEPSPTDPSAQRGRWDSTQMDEPAPRPTRKEKSAPSGSGRETDGSSSKGDGATSYTSRLLEAKKRALKKKNDGEE